MRWFRTNGARRYEPEVHLGVLAIIVVLLIINLLSNWSLQRFRVQIESDALTSLREISLVLSRQLEPEQLIVRPQSSWQPEVPMTVNLALFSSVLLSNSTIAESDEILSSIALRCANADSTLDEATLAAALHKLPIGELKALDAHHTLYAVLASRPGEKGTLILVCEIPVVSDLNRWTHRIMYASIVGLVLILIIYVLLIRRITQPIRELASHAALAGRPLDQTLDPATAVVRDYQRLVDELRDRERKLVAAHETLSEEAHRLGQIHDFALRSMTRGMLVLDDENRVSAANPAAVSFFDELGVSIQSGEMLQQFLGQIPDLPKLLKAVRDSGTPCRLVSALPTSRGTRTVEIVATAVRDHDAQLIGVGLLLTDMTNELAAAQERARHERLSSLGEMTAGLAHQLRNSLGAIRGFASLLRRRVPPESQAHLDQLLTEERQAEELIARFLSLSRPLEQHIESVNVESLIRETIDGFAERAKQLSITLRGQCTSSALVDADPLLLKQAIGNLVDNALYHTSPGGGISVTMGDDFDDSRVRIIVTDSGAGISESNKSKLFTPFFSTRASGTGLGLAFVRKVVEMHRGEMLIESQSGEGTTVTLVISRHVRGLNELAVPMGSVQPTQLSTLV